MQKEKSTKKKSGKLSTVLLIIAFVAGLSLLLYPTISNYWNSLHQTKAIASYTEAVAKISPEEYAAVWSEARDYNEDLYKAGKVVIPQGEERVRYENTLLLGDSRIMGYIEIPSIEVFLPVYHGTSDAVLQTSVGHLDWTSVPTGGENTHCVLSGHRGLPSAKLFTHLDRLVVGDIFMLRVLNEVLTYEVDQILVVEPQNIMDLTIVPGEDLCTLVTCTPYGINTHRMLVRGHRVANQEIAATVRVTADAVQIEPLIVAPILAIPLLIIIVIFLLATDEKRKKDWI